MVSPALRTRIVPTGLGDCSPVLAYLGLLASWTAFRCSEANINTPIARCANLKSTSIGSVAQSHFARRWNALRLEHSGATPRAVNRPQSEVVSCTERVPTDKSL